MPRSNVVVTRQPSVQMKIPHPIHQPHQSPIHQQHTSSASLSQSTASDLHSTPDNFVPHNPFAPHHVQDHQQIHPFVKPEQVAVPTSIPNSVKGAPAHLRPAIRKRQNSESAKRSRQRRKEAAKIFYQKFDEQCQRLSALEEKVATLIELVKETDEDRSPESRTKKEHDIVPEATLTQHPALQQPHTQPQTSDSDRPPQQSIVQTMAALSAPYEEEQHEQRSTPQIPFEDDLEALLETCIHSQHMFGSC